MSAWTVQLLSIIICKLLQNLVWPALHSGRTKTTTSHQGGRQNRRMWYHLGDYSWLCHGTWPKTWKPLLQRMNALIHRYKLTQVGLAQLPAQVLSKNMTSVRLLFPALAQPSSPSLGSNTATRTYIRYTNNQKHDILNMSTNFLFSYSALTSALSQTTKLYHLIWSLTITHVFQLQATFQQFTLQTETTQMIRRLICAQ